MKTRFVTPAGDAEVFLRIVEETETSGTVRPERFKKMMRENRGIVQIFSPFQPPEDHLERKTR